MNRLLASALMLAALMAAMPHARAESVSTKSPPAKGFVPAEPAEVIEASGYTPFKGDPFFLLSDAAYGSTDVARVRLEVPGRDNARSGLEQYGGVDIMVYRVPQPLEFLKKQSNLHRVDVTANYQGEGLMNALSQLWDTWWKKSRLAWRKLFSNDARLAVTDAQPKLATNDAIRRPTQFRNGRQYKPLKGFDLVEQFRYPLWDAKPIEAPKEVKLEGSSSEWTVAGAGNLMIPIGKRAPGLYLVEAMIGEHRATTLVFVSDTMAVTKVSSQQMLVWAARRDNGAVVPGVDVMWTDGSGVLQSGRTAANGVVSMERGSPEHTYVMGEDSKGGVFVSENFYYDSEIYNTKIYAVTDRPLYRPDDEVNVKFIGREFTSARVSQAAAAAPLVLTVFDPNGTPLLTQNLQLSPETGAETRFKLPAHATAGGYELRFTYRDTQYGAAFRVAEYIKPHFEMNIVPAKTDFKTGEKVKGRIELRYPDGKPVKSADVSLTLRAQQNTMVEGELRYSGAFPVEMKTVELTTDGSGNVDFTLPEAKEPSRYIMTVLASDGAAYRVKGTKEMLIERSASQYRLSAQTRFSNPGQTVRFTVTPEGVPGPKPVKWEMILLEKQEKTEGSFDGSKSTWDVPFKNPGSYQINLRDANGTMVGSTSHWVAGVGLKGTPGSIEIVLDHERYKAGETAEALITFSDPVEQALITLERDKVEQVGLIAGGADWVVPQRVAPNQWRVRIPVKAEYGPNITFSVAYTRQGDFVFQNAGLEIIEPRIALTFKTEKEVYQPGEKVTLDVTAQLDGKPVSTLVALGVVDEMIYVLQPEIAPEIGDFFYHPRRNNVRTTASLSFISYDLAGGRSAGAPARHNYNERGVKVLERPRRDNIDTALWAPSLKTDADGHVQVSFKMPDSLTRWRITGRAMDGQGRVGQRTGYVRSEKNFYAKWTAPNWLRVGDTPQAAIALFNQTAADQDLEVTLSGGGVVETQKAHVHRGVNYINFALTRGGGPMHLEVKQGGKVVDMLDTSVDLLAQGWNSPRSLELPLSGLANPLALPADARNVRVSFAQAGTNSFTRIADDLISYPQGGVEQTASRLIPLALALQSIGPESDKIRERLHGSLLSERLRLVSMAGPDAVFGWWGNAADGNALMTAYAYYADWYAARALGIELPSEHWQNLLTVYSKVGIKEPMLHRALTLWLAQEIGLPVKTLASGLADDLAKTSFAGKSAPLASTSSILMAPEDAHSKALTLVLLSIVSSKAEQPLAPELQGALPTAVATLQAHSSPMAQALLMLAGQVPVTAADTILATVRSDMPTIDRALTLVWIQKKVAGVRTSRALALKPSGSWLELATLSGQPEWLWRGPEVPKQVQMTEVPAAGSVALVRYESSAAEAHALPVKVVRRLLLLKQESKGFEASVVKSGDAVHTDALYLDEVTVTPAASNSYRFGMLDVSLPPGAVVEASTWGVKLLDEKEPLERATHTERREGYSVPVEALDGAVTVRHLVRFSQKGSYVIPPTRFYRLYQPDKKALEGEGKTGRTLRVE